MKRITSLLIIGLFIFSACNKDSSAPQANTIVADIDGTTETFNNTVVGVKLTTSGIYSIAVSGFHGDANSDRMSIIVGGPNAVTTGTFKFDQPAGQNGAVIVYTLAGGSDGYGPADLGGPDPILVTITSLTATNIQGTFSGTLALDDGSSPVHKVVANGKFNVNYH